MKIYYKIRLVKKGFMKQDYCKSDSLTITKESLKMFLLVLLVKSVIILFLFPGWRHQYLKQINISLLCISYFFLPWYPMNTIFASLLVLKFWICLIFLISWQCYKYSIMIRIVGSVLFNINVLPHIILISPINVVNMATIYVCRLPDQLNEFMRL